MKFSANNKYNKENDKGTGSKEEAYIRETISNLVLRKLKKTLRKEVKLENGCKMQMTEITISLMSAICLYGNAESFDPAILKAFFEKVDSDYTKYKYVEQIVKSIESQSAKLKVVEKDGKHLLFPANADHRKKKYVFEFMRKYAAAEEKEKREITEHIQNLIGLYLCGKAGYENAENRFSNMTESHNCISGEIEEIFNEIEELEKSSKQKKEEKKKTREELDKFAAVSQQKAEAAQKSGAFKDEIVPVEVKKKKETVIVDTDEGPRHGTTVETLGKLKPAFKKDGGLVTAGNSSGINDGAAAVVVMSEEKAKELGVKPMATWVAGALGGVDPKIMGIGPVAATRKVLKRTGMEIKDFDIIEANEAFAAQSVAVGKELGFDLNKLNPNGGAIALGHPVGASGCRILVTLLHEMEKADAKKGLATLCIGGGMGCATIVERD